MKVRKFHVRDLHKTPVAEWEALPNEVIDVEFEDGEIVRTNVPRIELSRKLWLAHDHYDIPITKRHHVGEGPVSTSRLEEILSQITRDIHETYGPGNYDREHVWYLSYNALNRLYNETIIEYSEYVRGLGSLEFQEIYDYPPIAELRKNLKPTEYSLAKTNKETEKIIKSDPNIPLNSIVSCVRADALKQEQLMQILVSRGSNTDIDDYIYPKLIMGNYYAGITDPAEMAMESTLASKAILFQGNPLRQTEYGNRKIQFTSQQVDLLVMGDCGSTYYSEFELTPGRFKDMGGNTYVDPETGELKALTEDCKHLIGETLKFRMPHYCGWRDRNCVCSTCYGTLAYSIPYGANIGHIASTQTQSEVSQRVLKVKHSENATVSEPIIISEGEAKFIRQSDDYRYILLQPELKDEKITMVVRSTPYGRAFNASKLVTMDLDKINPQLTMSRYSQFKTVSFDVPVEGKRPARYHVGVSRGTRTSYFTYDFLQYFFSLGLTPDSSGMINIPLDGWDFDVPVFELPNRHMNMKDFAAEVETFIRSTQDQGDKHLGRLKQLVHYSDPTEAMLDLHELITSKVSAHMTHVSVVILSMMVPDDPDCNDFRIPPLGAPFKFEKYNVVIHGRSLGASFPYQNGAEELLNHMQYLNTDRDQHLLDPILLPNP